MTASQPATARSPLPPKRPLANQRPASLLPHNKPRLQLELGLKLELKRPAHTFRSPRQTSEDSLKIEFVNKAADMLLALIWLQVCACSLAVGPSKQQQHQHQEQEHQLHLQQVHTDLDNHIHGDPSMGLSQPQLQPPPPLGQLYALGGLQEPPSNLNSLSANNTIPSSSSKKISASSRQQSASKLQRFLSERQLDLIKRNPGSLNAVARALKMAIVECQYQMRHEPWDCPIYGFSTRPSEVFGKLVSRSFKETSFIHSLLSSAVAHSIARACTESMITTCGRRQTRDGGYSEDIEFGRQFAQQFMEATHELLASNSAGAGQQQVGRNSNNIIAPAGSGPGSGEHQHQQQQQVGGQLAMEPTRKERKIRDLINAHNDEVGRLHVLNGMRRECKCHGLSGACNMQTCWLKLPPFREVASKLHDSLDQAIRVIYVAHNPTNRQKSLTSTDIKKSNKKRSSVNGPTRSSALSHSSAANLHNSNQNALNDPLIEDRASMLGSRQKGTKRHTNSDNCEDCYRTPVSQTEGGSSTISPRGGGGGIIQSAKEESGSDEHRSNRDLHGGNTTVVKKRPVARSIGIAASTISPSKFDLLYYEESPDFCLPDERYNIKGTKDRICSESPNAINNCERLCCDRGHKTEVREEKYKCECQFKFCCKLDCNTCTRRKVIHRCS